jgi:hypothetical protein
MSQESEEFDFEFNQEVKERNWERRKEMGDLE